MQLLSTASPNTYHQTPNSTTRKQSTNQKYETSNNSTILTVSPFQSIISGYKL